jgi:hypothetical protein
MNGSSLLGFLITLIVLFAIGFIFFLAIDKVVKDAFLAKIAKVVIGCLILIAFILAVAGVLGFGGGVTATPASIITFAVGVLVLVVVLYLVELFLGWLAANMGIGATIVDAIRFVITVVALIALILVAGSALIGGGSGYLPFRGLERHGALLQHDWSPARAVLQGHKEPSATITA